MFTANRPISPPPPYTPVRNNRNNDASVRPSATVPTRQDPSESEDEPFEWPSTAQEQDEIFRLTDEAASTPRKSLKTNAFATPAKGKRKASEMEDDASFALPTPSSSGSRGLHQPVDSAISPVRFGDPLSDIGGDVKHVQDEVFDVLRENGVTLTKTVGESLQKVLVRHDRRHQGVVKG